MNYKIKVTYWSHQSVGNYSFIYKNPTSEMEQIHASKNPSLEVISEGEPSSYNTQRTNYHSHNPPHVQFTDSITYEKSSNRSSSSNGGRINQGYNGDSQNSINREGSTPSIGG